ncbi:MAG: hypothetical protein IJ147_11875 [Lachnospiraceae bacterium]|nr:hypothetical protein [Lachnospiraceae bacterium]
MKKQCVRRLLPILMSGMMLAAAGCGQAAVPAAESQSPQSQTTESTGGSSQSAAQQDASAEAAASAENGQEATYLGVENYGAEETNKDHKADFRYRFQIGTDEVVLSVDNGTKDENGEYDYPIQNLLKENYTYRITTEGDRVVSVEEAEQKAPDFAPVVAGTPGEKTLENFLKTAMMPVGNTLYIYGGGWDWQDVGSAIQTRTLGVSPDWVRFFNEQNENYTYKSKDGDEANMDPAHSYYPYGGYNEYYYAGLDCSGYLGWVIYNTFETRSGEDGYVGGSTGFAKKLADYGWGTWTQKISVPDGTEQNVMKPGDIMSMNGHVWISLGTCSDKSVVIAHCTPSASRTGQPGGGVQIGAIGADETCEAYRLAEKYMSTYYPEWYKRYEVSLKDPQAYFKFEGEKAGRFTWDVSGQGEGLTDPAGVQNMQPEDVLKQIFGE